MQGKYRYNMIIFSSLIERDNVIISIICGDDDAMADVCECLILYLGSRFSIISFDAQKGYTYKEEKEKCRD